MIHIYATQTDILYTEYKYVHECINPKDEKENDVDITCNGARGIEILCKLGHVVEEGTTFSCREHNHQMHVFCIVSHVEKAPSPSDNLDIDKVKNDIEMHAPEDPAFS